MRFTTNCEFIFAKGQWLNISVSIKSQNMYYDFIGKYRAAPSAYPYISSTKKVAKLLKNKKIKENVRLL